MKLNEFITNVLVDIEHGLKSAQDQTDKKYFVELNDKRGVTFDIAVTTINSNSTQAGGKAKVGFVEVLGAGVGGKLDVKKENSEVSRIQFTVHVPDVTQTEHQESLQRLKSRGNGGVGW